MSVYSQNVDYACYDYNNKMGKVPWMDDPTLRANFVTQILYQTGR